MSSPLERIKDLSVDVAEYIFSSKNNSQAGTTQNNWGAKGRDTLCLIFLLFLIGLDRRSSYPWMAIANGPNDSSPGTILSQGLPNVIIAL